MGAARQEVRIPDLGDFDQVEVVDVMVAVGDSVAVEDPLITLETDKAAMDVPSTAAGIIKELTIKTGDQVGQGDLIVVVEGDADAVAHTDAASVAPQSEPAPDPGETISVKPELAEPPPVAAPPAAPPVSTSLPPIDEKTFVQAHASPSVRKFARELGVDLARVTGTGQKSRVIKDDVKAFVKAVLSGGAPGAAAGPAWPAVPEVDFAKFGEVDIQPLTRIQKISGPRLHASWVNLPHVTQNDEADITELEARRKRLKEAAANQGVRLTPLAFMIKAVTIALKEFPVLNSSLAPDQENLVLKKYFNIGFAADTPNGLIVPVIKEAHKKDVMSLAQELSDLSERGREGKLKAADMQGGTFTVSSLGGIGGTTFTPIINAPEVAILGLGRSKYQPVYKDGQFEPRLIQPLSLSYDHRVVDGAVGVRFTTHLADVLADVDRILLGS